MWSIYASGCRDLVLVHIVLQDWESYNVLVLNVIRCVGHLYDVQMLPCLFVIIHLFVFFSLYLQVTVHFSHKVTGCPLLPVTNVLTNSLSTFQEDLWNANRQLSWTIWFVLLEVGFVLFTLKADFIFGLFSNSAVAL